MSNQKDEQRNVVISQVASIINSFAMSFKSHSFLVVLSLFTVAYFSIRMLGLYEDLVNPDGINWHYRSFRFVKALKDLKFAQTYQEYHPGVTLMELTGPASYVFGALLNKFTGLPRDFSPENFLMYDFLAKTLVVIAGFVLTLISVFFLKKLVPSKILFIFLLFVLCEPFYIGVSRLYHLDFLLTQFMFLSFVVMYLHQQYFGTRKHLMVVLSGVFLGFGVLTKLTALFIFPVIVITLIFIYKKDLVSSIKYLLIYGVTAFFTFVVFFPAMWVNPVQTLSAIYEGGADVGYKGAKRVGLTRVHENIIDSVISDDTPVYFYVQTLVYQMTPVLILLLVAGVCVGLYNFINKNYFINSLDKDNFWLLSLVSFITLLVLLTIAGKKIDRYTVVVFPYLFIVVSYLISLLNPKVLSVCLVLYVFSLIPQYSRIYPYYYAYANPLFGGLKVKYSTVGVKPFGVAMYELDSFIRSDYGIKNTKATVVGSKSLNYILPNADVYKELAWCPKCEYVVVYKADLPKDAPGSSYALIKIIYVDNLDYWYIYKRK